MIGTDFDDYMSHRIQVTDMSGRDDFGRITLDETTTRTYMCFIAKDKTVARTAAETNITENMVAYTKAIPIGSDVPVPIDKEAKVIVLVPEGFPELPVTSILAYYDDDGTDYCYEVKFGSGSIPRRG